MTFSSARSCVKLLTSHVILGCGNCWCWYSKTCEFGHQCNLVICQIWPHRYGTSKFLRYYTWSLLHNVATCGSWNWTAVVTLFFSFHTLVTNLLLPTDLNNCMLFGSKSSFISRTVFCPLSFHSSPQVWAIYWNILVATDPFVKQSRYRLGVDKRVPGS